MVQTAAAAAAAATHMLSAARNIITNPILSAHPPLLFFNYNNYLRLKLLNNHTTKIISSSSISSEELSMKRFIQSVGTCCFLGVAADLINPQLSNAAEADVAISFVRDIKLDAHLMLADLELDPDTAKLAIGFIGPFLSAFSFLFIVRIVMSWYPKIPLEKFPYVVAYAPTEPFLVQTRKLIPPLAGVDITPVVWVGLLNFLNEILVGPQGLLVLLSQQLTTK